MDRESMSFVSRPIQDAANRNVEVRAAGFALVAGLINATTVDRLRSAVELAIQSPLARSRRGSAYGLRNLFEVMPAARELACSDSLMDLVKSVLGPEAWPVKGILFDKTEHANWAVPWHQDITIAVKAKRTVPGYDAWSEKDGIPHVQPPTEILENMLAVRIHLDPCPAKNGALKVIPGSHKQGRLSDAQVEHWLATVPPMTCVGDVGDALLMRPLLLHSSGSAVVPDHRRVLHFEYAAIDLPSDLEWGV